MSELKDLTGQRFGKLVVIKKVPNSKGLTTWLCQCDCGNQKVVLRSNLIRGLVQSCGCLRKKKDLTGKIFGELTVLKFDKYYKKNPKWLCQCSCGEIVSVFENGLKLGMTKNCGGVIHEKYIGQKFGKLTVLPEVRYTKSIREYLCQCDCGNQVFVRIGNLTSGNTRSCGCLAKNIDRHNNYTKIKKVYPHRSEEYKKLNKVWYGIKKRCADKSNKNYGGRGIKVCDEWHDFQSFYNWAIANGYCNGLTIDRIDNDGDYCPENCRWITNLEQQNNRRNNHYITYQNETKSLADWARTFNISYDLLYKRITELKWDFERAIKSPPDKIKSRKDSREKATINGKTLSLIDWANEQKISIKTIYTRLERGWTKEEAILKPVRGQH